MGSFKKFPEDKLPDRSNFYSSLKNECISKIGYLHANNICSMFKVNTMGDYHYLYLKTDVLLLADVFEKFISTCLEYYRLDSFHYFSSPGLSWDAMLKMTKTELELISDIDMDLFIGFVSIYFYIFILIYLFISLFITLLKDIVKQIINTDNYMIIKNQVYIAFI